MALLDQHGSTLRKAAEHFGVSRSFLQRRAKLLLRQNARSICTPDREKAGVAPLASGHPISWGAIVTPLQAAAATLT